MNAHDKEIERTVAQAIQKVGVKKTPPDFSATVMQAIALQQEKVNDALTYTPLISKKVWWIIAAIISVVLLSSVFTASEVTTSNFIRDLSLSYKALSFSVPKIAFEVSNALLIGVSFVAVFLCIEMPLLRKFYDRT